ncbi:MAG: aldo/keto reductase [Clostridiales bacterium]|jgi:diketogulonate reductase-like aldo/keto reductase|nr:aldo/keto reductase [Clostridiales bacterium]
MNNIKKTTTLNNGVEMPVLGLGVYKSGGETYNAVRTALDAGYRRIDTAAVYGNEADTGKAVGDSGLGRGEVFITTKVWNDDLRARNVRGACLKSLALLDTDYIDLYLIHWPVPGEYTAAYKVIEELYAEGKVRAIGLSNHLRRHTDEILSECSVAPVLNQLEIHPYFQNTEETEYCKLKNILPEAWAPLARGAAANDPAIIAIAEKYSKTPSQVVLRWHLQRGTAVIPKSVHKERIIENADVFDFALGAEDMASIGALNKNERTGPDPNNIRF